MHLKRSRETLNMSQAQMICEAGEKPILMLDDLSSEFDEKHLGKVLRAGLELGTQILLTGTVLPPAIKTCKSHFTVFHVKHGSVTAMSV